MPDNIGGAAYHATAAGQRFGYGHVRNLPVYQYFSARIHELQASYLLRGKLFVHVTGAGP